MPKKAPSEKLLAENPNHYWHKCAEAAEGATCGRMPTRKLGRDHER